MNILLLRLNKKRTDTLIDQTKTKPQETLEFKMNKQMQIFSFSPPLNLVGEGKWFLRMIFFECTNSVFNINNENNSLSITIPSHWETKSAEKSFDELNKVLELWSQNGFQLHVGQVRKRGVILMNNNPFSSLGTFKNEILEKLKNVKYKDLEDLVYRFQLTYDEIIDILDLNHISTKRTGYSLNFGLDDVSDINKTLESISSDNVKVSFTIDDIRLKSNTKKIKLYFSLKSLFLIPFLGFTQTLAYPLDDIDGFHQLIAGSFKID